MSNEVYVAANAQLGNGLVSEVVKRFGPILAEVLLKWLMNRQQAGLVPAQALLDSGMLRSFLAGQLKAHREEILTAVNVQTASLFDAGVAALEG